MAEQVADLEYRLHKIEHRTALPMLVLSICFVPVLVIPLLYDLNPIQDSIVDLVDHLLWSCFAVEYFIRFLVARDRVRFIAHNLVDLAIVALPLLRPVRVVSNLRTFRLLQASRLIAAGFRGRKLGDSIVNHTSVAATAFVIASLTTTAAAMVYNVERYAPGSHIRTVGDAFWWAVVTLSTVGYGDYYPVTTEGRVIACCLMLIGIGTSALIAAAFASVFIRDRNEEEFDPKLEALAHRLDRIDGLLLRLESTVEAHERRALERETLHEHELVQETQ